MTQDKDKTDAADREDQSSGPALRLDRGFPMDDLQPRTLSGQQAKRDGKALTGRTRGRIV